MGWADELLSRVPLGWLLGALVVYHFVDKGGIIQKWLGRPPAKVTEREQFSEEVRAFISNLTDELEEVRKRYHNDAVYYQGLISELRVELRAKEDTNARLTDAINKAVDTVLSSERGNARIRHALANWAQYVGALRSICHKNGIQVPPYEGWRDMLGINDDLDQKLRELFEGSKERGVHD